MREHRNKIIVGLALLAVVSGAVVACSSGGGPIDIVGPYDRPPDSRDKPPDSRDNPGSSTDTPPSSLDNPGSQGGGPASGGGSSNCPPCDGTFTCVTTANGQTASAPLVLKTIDGTCQAVNNKGKSQGTVACGGALVEDGMTGGQWTSTGPDNLNATTTEAVDGGVVTVTSTCTRTTDATPTPTPTVTGTGTSAPPVPDSGISVTDAGKL